MARRDAGSYQVEDKTPVDLKITIGYAHDKSSGSSVVLDGKDHVTDQTNPMTVPLAKSGKDLNGKTVFCKTTVIPTIAETRKVGVTYEVIGATGKSPIPLDDEAAKDESFVVFSATLSFHL